MKNSILLLFLFISISSCAPVYQKPLFALSDFDNVLGEKISILPMLDFREKPDKDRSLKMSQAVQKVFKKNGVSFSLMQPEIFTESLMQTMVKAAFTDKDCASISGLLSNPDPGWYLLLTLDKVVKKSSLKCNSKADVSLLLFDSESGKLIMKNKGFGDYSDGLFFCNIVNEEAIRLAVLDAMSAFYKK